MHKVEDQALNCIYRSFMRSTSARISHFPSCSDNENFTMEPFLVSLGGVAGSGKTSLGFAIGQRLKSYIENERGEETRGMNIKVTTSDDRTSATTATTTFTIGVSSVTVLPMDGYHLYRSELSAMSNAEEAFRRRGAPWTFNAAKYADDMTTLKRTGKLSAPAFEHSVKDPVEDAYKVDATTRTVRMKTSTATSDNINSNSVVVVQRAIVLVEGIYALYDDGALWKKALDVFDCLLYLKVSDMDVATERLTQRHMRVWGIPREEAHERAAGSDRDNGLLVIESAEKNPAVVVLKSVDDLEFVMKSPLTK